MTVTDHRVLLGHHWRRLVPLNTYQRGRKSDQGNVCGRAGCLCSNIVLISGRHSLKEKGVNISDKGVSLKTQQRFTREDYIDATQRAFMKLPASGAASFGHADDINKPSPPMKRTPNGSPVAVKGVSTPSRTNSGSGDYFPASRNISR